MTRARRAVSRNARVKNKRARKSTRSSNAQGGGGDDDNDNNNNDNIVFVQYGKRLPLLGIRGVIVRMICERRVIPVRKAYEQRAVLPAVRMPRQ